MKNLYQFIVFAFLLIGCSKTNLSKKNERVISPPINNMRCREIVNNNLIFLQNATTYYTSDFKINNEVYLNELINCCLDNQFIVDPNIKTTLLDYCNLYIEDRISLNMHPTFFNKSDDIGRILSEIIDKNSFKLHLKIFSYNKCDMPGHGIESSTGVGYFEYMMLPLINKINGIPANDFYKEYKLENYFFVNREDCGLNYYNKSYLFITQAWEEGKIELKETINQK